MALWIKRKVDITLTKEMFLMEQGTPTQATVTSTFPLIHSLSSPTGMLPRLPPETIIQCARSTWRWLRPSLTGRLRQQEEEEKVLAGLTSCL